MIDTVLIDFDGTLMNTREGIVNSWKHLYKVTRNIEPEEEVLKVTFGEPLRTSLEKFFPEMDPDDALAIYKEYQAKHHEQMMKPFPGVVEMVKKLKVRGFKVALVTSRGEKSSVEGLEMCGILNCFDELITANKCEKHKPEPEPIYMAMERLGSAPEHTVMIGDTMYDLISAKRAGVKSILVGWNVLDKKPEDMGEYAPDEILQRAEDIFDVLEKF